MRGLIRDLPRSKIELYVIFPGQACRQLRYASIKSVQNRDETSDWIESVADQVVRVPTVLASARDVIRTTLHCRLTVPC